MYENVSPGRRSRRQRSAGGFLPGFIIGILVTVIVAGILFALRGGSGSQPGLIGAGGESYEGGAVDKEAIEKLRDLEMYADFYYYKTSEVTDEQQREGMYKGLLNSFGDVYTCYFTAEEYKNLLEQTQGVFYGIGAYVSKDVETGYCVISGIIKDSPAASSDLMEGDIIYKVDGEEMAGLELDEVVSRIKGEEGTDVTITVMRGGEQLDMTIKRARVNSPTVDSRMLDNGIGYLQITEFDDITTEQFRENMESLKSQGMKGLIIDLRGNPGGNVTTVCEIAEELLPEGIVFYMKNKDGNRTDYPCKGADFDLPLVVLVNEYSASASEILSGAVKDSGIGTLVGKKTYGKGVVQNVIPMDDGSAIKVTVANYYTRGGNDINLRGIEPDVEVDLDADKYLEDETDTQLEKAVEVMMEKLETR